MELSNHQRKIDIGHVLDAPDMYIGPIQPAETTNWVAQEVNYIQNTSIFPVSMNSLSSSPSLCYN
jgi:hypothetical protein